MKQLPAKFMDNKSQLIEQNQISLPSNHQILCESTTICKKIMHNQIFKELSRFTIYFLICLVLISFVTRNQSSTIYSISNNGNDPNLFLMKQIPGIFPPLSTDQDDIIASWNIILISGKSGARNFRQEKFELEFKHSEKKQNVLYITKNGCGGHIVMNWQLYGSNIYITDFVPPKGSMTIPNLPKDQQCIRQNNQILNLLKYTTIWTITENQQKNSLFLLIEETGKQMQQNKYVLIAEKVKKI